MRKPGDEIDVEALELTERIKKHLAQDPKDNSRDLSEIFPSLMISHAYLIEHEPWAHKPLGTAAASCPIMALEYAEKIKDKKLRDHIIAIARENLKKNFEIQ